MSIRKLLKYDKDLKANTNCEILVNTILIMIKNQKRIHVSDMINQ